LAEGIHNTGVVVVIEIFIRFAWIGTPDFTTNG